MFFLAFLWWIGCYIFSSWYVFLIVTSILRNETLCFNICLTPISPLSHFKKLPSPIFNFLNFFDENGTSLPHPLQILKKDAFVIAYNFQKQNYYKLSRQFSPKVVFVHILRRKKLAGKST